MEGREKGELPAESHSTTTTIPAETAKIGRPTATALPRMAIRNPYATGRSSSAHAKKIKFTGSANNDNDDANETGSTSNSNTSGFSGHSTDAKASIPGIETSKTGRDHSDQQTQDLAFWERLPSRNVSFTSAEVLTVTECLNQSIAKLYCDGGRSVRITGILHQRSLRPTEDKNEASVVVEMEVMDPMTTTTRAVAERVRQRHSKLAASATLQKRQPTASSRLSRSRNSGIHRNEEQKRMRYKKRPWFVSSSTPGITKPRKAATTASATASATLRVIVDPRSVVGADKSLRVATVGSFVTVIGEFVVVDLESGGENPGDARGSEPRFELEARTLRVINNHCTESNNTRATTDMVFYEKALALRRKTMYERYYYSNHRSPANETSDDQAVRLLQGCGPPPYDAYDQELASKSLVEPERKGS